MTAPVPVRTYRFGPLDRSGLVLGLSGRQCAVLGAGALLAGWLLDRHAAAPIVFAPLLVALSVSFARVGGETVCDLLPVASRFSARWVCQRHRWFAPVPFSNGSGVADHGAPDLPPFMAGLVVVDAGPVDWAHPERVAGVGVVADPKAGTVSGTLRVHGNGFALADRSDQERLVAGWGDVLGGFCRERGSVSSLRWTETAAPVSLEPYERWREGHGDGRAEILADYHHLLSHAATGAYGHEVLVTVTVDQRRMRQRPHRRSDVASAANDVLLEELRLLSGRLEAAGLPVAPPLSAAELTDVLQRRLDPHGTLPLGEGSASLSQAAGVVCASGPAPLASEVAWSHLRVDTSAHRSFWVAEWPRLDVGPNWIEPLLLSPGGIRTVSVIYEPVPPGRSQRQVDREATKLASDEEQRARSGFRIGARHRRQEGALAEREAELVAGYAELCFAGFVTVSAADVTELDRACADTTQAAAQAGLELRRLDGRHEQGLLCALPVGRGLAERRMP